MSNLSTSSKAYKIFLEELLKHLANAQAIFASDSEIDSEKIRIVGSAFHTIKGGAGFFGLSEVANLAGEIEGYFLKNNGDFSVEHAQRMISDFQLLADKLPNHS